MPPGTPTNLALIIDIFCTSALPIAKDLNLLVTLLLFIISTLSVFILSLPSYISPRSKSKLKRASRTSSPPLKETHMPEPTHGLQITRFYSLHY
jgi:hypothetical protein